MDAAYVLAVVRSLLAEYSSVKCTDDQLNKWIQEAAIDISIKTLGYESIDTIITTANTLECNEPSGTIKIHSVVFKGITDPCSIAHTSVSYDSDNPATIARNDSDIEITISDGIGPFTWAVSGTGFSLGSATTTGRSNTLNADGTACGSATITVTDVCSDSDTGYVRCTSGQWVLKTDDVCVLSGTGTLIQDYGTYWDYEFVQGNKKQWQRTSRTVSGGITCADLEANWSGPPNYYWEKCTEQSGVSQSCDGTATPCTNCIGITQLPLCTCIESAGPSYICYCLFDLKYYEWEC